LQSNKGAKHPSDVERTFADATYLHSLIGKNVPISLEVGMAEVIKWAQDPKVSSLINASLDAYNQKDYQKCIDLCDAAISIDPNSYLAYSNKCAAYILMQKYDEAIEAGKKTLSINPNYKYGIGNLKWATDEKAKAEAAKK
jgi:tetratricopeptide (TPR) repeat protein